MKNYEYVLDVETPFIKKLYDKENDYKVEFLTPYGILEELKKLQKENVDLEAKLAKKEKELRIRDITIEVKNKRLKDYDDIISIIHKQNKRDKISLTVEQLEKILKHFVYCGNEIVSDYCLDCEVDELKAEIDNQIKQLKEGK